MFGCAAVTPRIVPVLQGSDALFHPVSQVHAPVPRHFDAVGGRLAADAAEDYDYSFVGVD